ncbi:MAG: MFS transporter [Lachnospiraceae bacterium]|nr:MFS transporter [Lachnospiraceae bacterium]
MKAKKYFLSMVAVYMAYLTHGMQALIFSQNQVNFAIKWGFDMSDPNSAAYAAGAAAVSTAIAWTGFGKFISVWIGGEISDRVGRKKLMIGGAALYIICFAGMFTTTNATVAAFLGLLAGVATSGFWDASGYPAVQEAYPAAPGTALIMIKFFVALSSIFYPLICVKTAEAGNWQFNIILPLVLSVVVLVLAVLAPFAYDDEKKAGAAGGVDANAIAAEIQAGKDRQLVAPGAFTKFITYFYAFLVMAVMYGAQQYTKAFGLAYCGLSEIQAASMTTIYQVGSIAAVAFWAVMMSKLKWHPLKVLIVDSVMTAAALLVVLLVHQVAIIYVAILVLGFGCAGGALQTGLSVVQEFVPGPKGRNTGIYYTFMGLASYTLPTVVKQLTIMSGESAATYTLMMLMCGLAVVQTVATVYLIARYKKVFGKTPLAQ